MAVIFLGKSWVGRYTGFLWYLLKCFTISSSLAHTQTSCCESPRWDARHDPKLPAPKTRTLELLGGWGFEETMVNEAYLW